MTALIKAINKTAAQCVGACYARHGHPAGFLAWVRMTLGENLASYQRLTIDGFCDAVRAMKPGQVWRMSVQGDLPFAGDWIYYKKRGGNKKLGNLAYTAQSMVTCPAPCGLGNWGTRTGSGWHEPLLQIARANHEAGARGFGFTHFPVTDVWDVATLGESAKLGLVINLSCDGAKQAMRTPIDVIPVAHGVHVPKIMTYTGTPGPRAVTLDDGQLMIACPAEYRDDVTCETCPGTTESPGALPWCARADRKFIVGFSSHGGGAKLLDAHLVKIEGTEQCQS